MPIKNSASMQYVPTPSAGRDVMAKKQTSLIDRIAARMGGLPSPLEVGRKLGLNIPDYQQARQAAVTLGELMGPGADVKGMVQDSGKIVPNLRQGNYGQALGNLGMAAAAIPMMAIPGTVAGVKKGVQGVLDDLIDPQTGTKFKTGEAATFPFIRNTEKAPDMGEQFGQHIEPAGRYMQTRSAGAKPIGGWEFGDVTFKNPLVVKGEGLDWKKKVSEAYDGKTGKELSQALADDGFDGIVTTSTLKGGEKYTSEIVDLTSFKSKRPELGLTTYSDDAARDITQEQLMKVAQRNAALPVEKGGLGLKKNNTPLERANAMGYTDKAYHGAQDAGFDAFDPAVAINERRGTGNWLSSREKIAQTYGPDVRELLVNTKGMPQVDLGGANWSKLDPQHVTYQGAPLVDQTGNMFNATTNDISRASGRQGLPGTVLNNVADVGPHRPNGLQFSDDADYLATDYAIHDPSRIRDIKAAFDPARRKSASLLAGAAGLGVIAPTLLQDDEYY